MTVEIRTGVSAAAQESMFMNATLQGAGEKLAFSVAVHVEVPEEAHTSERALADYLRGLFERVFAAEENVTVEVEVGPENGNGD